jgi:hypothetical protein
VNSSETYDGVCGAAGLDRAVGREGGRACRSARLSGQGKRRLHDRACQLLEAQSGSACGTGTSSSQQF